LLIIQDWLQKVPEIEANRLDRHLVTLIAALRELDNGIVEPLLVPQRRIRGGQGQSEWRRKTQGLAAAAITILVQVHHEPLKNAESFVAKVMRSRDFKVTAKELHNWRKRFASNRGVGLSLERDAYSKYLSELRPKTEQSCPAPEVTKRALEQMFQRWFASFAPAVIER
jgi:hypothetical protein